MLRSLKPIWWVLYSVLYFYCIFAFLGLIPMASNLVITWLSMAASLGVVLYMRDNHSLPAYGFTTLHIVYTIFLAFGLGWVNFLLGDKYLSDFTAHTLRFLRSEQYAHAVALSIISVMTYIIGVSLATHRSRHKHPARRVSPQDFISDRLIYFIGCLMISTMIIFLGYSFATGQLSIYSNYAAFREMIADNIYYSWIITFYATGICYVVASGDLKRRRFGILMYTAAAVVLFATGNKGEVLYSLLACLAILQYKGYKLNWKPMAVVFIIAFVVIPFVTATRKEGVVNNLTSIQLDFTDTFVEVGMQIRCTVYILDQFAIGIREYIDGFSYFNPLVVLLDRMIPFVGLKLTTPASFDFKTVFASQGFNQIAEGYANFGITGSMLYYLFTGYIFAHIEKRKMSARKLAYFASIITIFINAARNKFAFVFGQILIMTFIYLVITILKMRRSGAKS